MRRQGIQIRSIIALFAIGVELTLATQATPRQATPDETRGVKPREYSEKVADKVASSRPSKGRWTKRGRSRYVPAQTDDTLVFPGLDFGVTLWRLREARPADPPEAKEETRIAVRQKGKTVDTEMVAERANGAATFSDGEFMRMSLEVPAEGFLYVIDREQYSDGSFSLPYLIFPSAIDIGKNDKGRPGGLVYVPSATDYFKLKSVVPDKPDKIAEVFTIIVSPMRLSELPPLSTGEQYRELKQAVFDRWVNDWSARVWRFEQEGGPGTLITRAERQSLASGGTRLGADDPLPQTVLHVGRKFDRPILLTISAVITK